MSKLVLLRHGESMWNKKNVFTGWVDVPLSKQGVQEALDAGKRVANILFDVIYTSTLVRAIETTMLCMTENNSRNTPVVVHEEGGKLQEWSQNHSEEMQQKITPVYTDWHLNERYYGDLQGHNKKRTMEIYGDEQVHLWRRSYDAAPPNGECLKDTAARTIPFFKSEIVPALAKDQNVLIVAHGNSLRSIVMYLEQLNEAGVLKLEIDTGVPLLYTYKQGKFSK